MTIKPKVVVIGGGTGSFAVLSGLKKLDCELSALVNMADDGGSTGQLRDEYGVLPPGDVRQCLVALSDAPTSLRDLFNFRFPGDGNLGGHSFGNLFISAVEMMTDNFSEAIKVAGDILNIKGKVIPITTDKCHLVLQTADGMELVGQRSIELKELPLGEKPKLHLTPRAKLSNEASKAIAGADLIVIAPGSLYGSIIPALLADGMEGALKKAKAPLVYICNLVNKPHNTKGYMVTDYIGELERYIGDGEIDFVLYNTDIPTEELLRKYAEEEEYPVIINENDFVEKVFKAIPGNFLSHTPGVQDKNERYIRRTLLRHDSVAVAKAVQDLING